MFKYPVVNDLAKLGDNRAQVTAIEAKVEARLMKKGMIEDYNKEMQGYLERGTFREISEDEMREWKGAVNYISHHDVPKPSSKSTKLRIVSNSSLPNNNGGLSYNDCLPKGPNSLIPLIEALAAWRQYPRVVTWDYSKCYNSVYTTERELHCRRFVWRFSQSECWKVYGIDRMHFGDKPAAIGLDVAKHLVAAAGREIDPAAAGMIERDYVDDGFGGGDEDDVLRLMGEIEDENGDRKYRGTVPTIMEKGGFYIKYMVRDGESRPGILEQFSGAVLGVPWDTEKDNIKMQFTVNLSPKVQKVHQGDPVKLEQVCELDGAKLTKRIMLSQIYSIYNPLGLLSPIAGLTSRSVVILQALRNHGEGLVIEGLTPSKSRGKPESR